MSQNKEFLHGLQDYFDYKEDQRSKDFIKSILDICYSQNPKNVFCDTFIKKHIMENDNAKDILLNDVSKILYANDVREQMVNSFLPRDLAFVYGSNDFERALVFWALEQIEISTETKLTRYILDYLKKDGDPNIISDAFSRSQMRSKIWLAQELARIGGSSTFKNIVLLAGWYGQFVEILTTQFLFEKCRIIELDKDACLQSDFNFNLNRLENYKVKSINEDINNLTLHTSGYEWNIENFKTGQSYTEKFSPDLIINTSSEHMDTEWYNQIRFKQWDKKPIVAIQSNNFFDIEDHVNCVHSIDHMKKIYPMENILFEGELQLKGYKRVMLIGRP